MAEQVDRVYSELEPFGFDFAGITLSRTPEPRDAALVTDGASFDPRRGRELLAELEQLAARYWGAMVTMDQMNRFRISGRLELLLDFLWAMFERDTRARQGRAHIWRTEALRSLARVARRRERDRAALATLKRLSRVEYTSVRPLDPAIPGLLVASPRAPGAQASA